jgi:outer membrane lipoprotein carrier protein
MRTIFIVFLSFCFTAIYSQRDEKAFALLEEVSNATKSTTSIKADFMYTMDNPSANIHETRKGTLLVSGDKYQLKAAGQTIFCDGKTVWTYIGESNEVQISDLNMSDDAITPSRLLTSYNANYRSKIISDKDAAADNLVAVELLPTKSTSFSKAILIIDKNLKQVKMFKIFDKNGNTFTYKVTLYQTNIPVKAGDFTFMEADYPDVEVIDMR